MNVTVFDYGAGNLHSLAKALAEGGDPVRIEPDPRAAVATDVLVLPGVGAFASAAERLAPGREAMRAAILAGLPCLGICLGMQLLFDRSEEGAGRGLGLLAGGVTRLDARRVPQIGWNTVEAKASGADPRPDPLFEAAPLEFVYYAHSFVCRPADPAVVTAWTTHENDRFAAAVRWRSVVGVQFHPEKSSRAGVRFVRAFLDTVRAASPGAPPPATGANGATS
jgi:imidazole glycerol-phosphate synthase subunit HisH